MRTISLERRIQNVIKIDRSRSVIELGVNTYPYLEVTSVDVPDILTNSRVKIINGLFTGGEDITLIRARNHYPHSIGQAWCYDDPRMYGYGNTAVIVSMGEFYNGNHTKNYINNKSVSKEYCFWSADDGLRMNSEDKLTPYAMKYDTIIPLAPAYGTEDYYADKIEHLFADIYLPFETPAGWHEAEINQVDKTFSVGINMLPFWEFPNTPAYQTQLNWKYDYGIDNIHSLQYDVRLQAIELEIHCSFRGKAIVGTRWIYIYHCPQAWSVPNTHKIYKIDGFYLNLSPSSAHQCVGEPPSWFFDTGYTASGGSVEVSCGTSGEVVKYDNILLISESNPNNTLSFESEIFDTVQIKRAWKGYPSFQIEFPSVRRPIDEVNPDDPATFDYCELITLGSISIEDGFIISEEFISEEELYYVYLLVDYTNHIMGSTTEIKTAIHPTGVYCAEGYIGSILNKKWVTLGEDCDDATTIALGNFSVYCETNLDLVADDYFTDGVHKAECDTFDSGSNLAIMTRQVLYGGVETRITNKGSDNDLEFTILQGFQTTPKWWQEYYSLIALPLYGYAGVTPSRIMGGYNYPLVVNDLILDGEHTGINPQTAIAERILQE